MGSVSPIQPRWLAAAQALIDGCLDLREDEDRVALLIAVCEGLGDELYPAFIRVLWTIGQHGDHAAHAAVARALVHALRTGRLPGGRRSAWGASAVASSTAAYGRTRLLGPLEYLCVWHAQTDPARALSAAQFHTAARALMDLIAASREARLLYCEKLLADVDDPIVGALARPTREGLRQLATAWAEGASASDASARFLCALRGPRDATSLWAVAPQPACALR
ncbi:MAG TPA: hypothetical protein VF169_21825 [Albitalea sp.]|uniref:hypothetical protein n=1 Tax=Piscinibacter sp. TaxID=1903157 RepID=UPI002ED2C5BC